MQSILDLITERQAVVAAAIATLREQMGKLTDELRAAETELNDLATTRTTLTRLTSMSEAAMPDTAAPDNTVYQQIITAFTTGTSTTMRAKDVCHVLGIGTEPKDTEGVRAKLKTPGQTRDSDRIPSRPVHPPHPGRADRTGRHQQP